MLHADEKAEWRELVVCFLLLFVCFDEDTQVSIYVTSAKMAKAIRINNNTRLETWKNDNKSEIQPSVPAFFHFEFSFL